MIHPLQVKLALSQDIVLTTISPQRSVMATAVHNLQEVNISFYYNTWVLIFDLIKYQRQEL